MIRNTREPAELAPLNEDTPALDEPVAVEWWHDYDDDESPKLDTFHGFHDATQVADDEPPAVETGELVTESGVRVTTENQSAVTAESRHLFITYEEALSRDISPCTECFPEYATEMCLAKEREDGGLLTEPGVESAVFVVQTRRTLSSLWKDRLRPRDVHVNTVSGTCHSSAGRFCCRTSSTIVYAGAAV